VAVKKLLSDTDSPDVQELADAMNGHPLAEAVTGHIFANERAESERRKRVAAELERDVAIVARKVVTDHVAAVLAKNGVQRRKPGRPPKKRPDTRNQAADWILKRHGEEIRIGVEYDRWRVWLSEAKGQFPKLPSTFSKNALRRQVERLRKRGQKTPVK
jgi:hypothetical protein